MEVKLNIFITQEHSVKRCSNVFVFVWFMSSFLIWRATIIEKCITAQKSTRRLKNHAFFRTVEFMKCMKNATDCKL